jgi:hypothetical protein
VISHGARRVLLAAILVHAAGASPLSGQTVAQRATAAAAMAITHVGVVEVRAGRVVPNRTVLFADGHITAIRAALPTDSALRGAIDGRGRFLIPGLTDMHAHFDGPPALFVANGITSVRKTMGFAGTRSSYAASACTTMWRSSCAPGSRRRRRFARRRTVGAGLHPRGRQTPCEPTAARRKLNARRPDSRSLGHDVSGGVLRRVLTASRWRSTHSPAARALAGSPCRSATRRCGTA